MNKEKLSSLYAQLIEEGKRIAIANCAGGYPNRSDCTWYHGNWMLLRYLGLVSNPFWVSVKPEGGLKKSSGYERIERGFHRLPSSRCESMGVSAIESGRAIDS